MRRSKFSMKASLAHGGHSVGSEEALVRMPRGLETLANGRVADSLRGQGQTCKLDLSVDFIGADIQDRLAAFTRTALPVLAFGLVALPR